MKPLSKFRHDKLALLFLLIVIGLGIFIRLTDLSKTGYWNDDMSTIPTGLLIFYPYPLYPGLAGQGEPILGNFFIGAGCMLSGEDFSKVSEIKPMFYPGREILIGKQLTNAFPYCHLPMYLFGILFFLVITLLSLSLLNKYESLFSISFYAFYPTLLRFSRWIHVDIFGYFFIALGLLFLWHAYISKRNNKEILFFILSFLAFGLAFTTKLPNGMFLLFAIFILAQKYSKELLQSMRKIGTSLALNFLQRIKPEEGINYSRPLKIFLYSILIYLFIFLAVFYFNPKNFFDVLNKYQSLGTGYSTLSFNTGIFEMLSEFFLSINILDVILVFFSLWILFRLIRSRKRKQKEKFILSLFLFLILNLLISRALNFPRVLIAFFFGLIFLMSLSFSREYSIFNIFKIKKKKYLFFIFLTIYIVFSFTIAYSASPHFKSKNSVLCHFNEKGCQLEVLTGFAQKDIADYLASVLKENETFLPHGLIIYYYLRYDQHLQEYLFDQFFFKKLNRDPTLKEKIQYFHPHNQTVRYLVIPPSKFRVEDEFVIELRENFIPNHIIKIKDSDAAWIYDLENLTKKKKEE